MPGGRLFGRPAKSHFTASEQIARLRKMKQRVHPVVRRIDHAKIPEPYLARKAKDPRIKLMGVRQEDPRPVVFDPSVHAVLPEDR